LMWSDVVEVVVRDSDGSRPCQGDSFGKSDLLFFLS
jgi:hypothetical protein